MKKRYQIRAAAGIHWLLDMDQRGYPEYHKPVPLNDSAVEFFCLLQEKMSVEEIARKISSENNITEETVRADLAEFIEQLRQRGIFLPDCRDCSDC